MQIYFSDALNYRYYLISLISTIFFAYNYENSIGSQNVLHRSMTIKNFITSLVINDKLLYTFYISSRFMSLQLFANFYLRYCIKTFSIHLLIAFRLRYQSTSSSSFKRMHTSKNICVEIRGESFLIVSTQQIICTLYENKIASYRFSNNNIRSKSKSNLR